MRFLPKSDWAHFARSFVLPPSTARQLLRLALALAAVATALMACASEVKCSCPSQPVPGMAVSLTPWLARHPEARQVQVCYANLCQVLRPVSNEVLASSSVRDSRPHPLLVRLTDDQGVTVFQREASLALRDTHVQACCGGRGTRIFVGTATLRTDGALTSG